MIELTNWIEEKNLNCSIKDNIISIKDFGVFLFVDSKDDKIIDDNYAFILNEDENDLLSSDEIKFIVFKWGDKFFYSEKKTKKDEYNETVYEPRFNEFVNVGVTSNPSQLDFIHLGMHDGYELLNGSGEPEAWVSKAKFFKQSVLGVCNKNTLASTLPLQEACKKKSIKSVLGETISVAYDYKENEEQPTLYDLKLYVKDYEGWRNLLRINKFINVDLNRFIPEEELLKLTSGLICIIATDSYFNKILKNKNKGIEFIQKYKKAFGKENLFYQIDSVEYNDDEIDIGILNNIKIYIDSYSGLLKPVVINDSYYIEKQDFKVKKFLNTVDRKPSYSSEDQYYKSADEVLEKFVPFFNAKNESKLDIIIEGISNTKIIADNCNYQIDTGNHKLPKFEVKNPTKLYHKLIAEGFQKKVFEKFEDDEKTLQYIERLDEENSVIVGAGFVDYFLILWDVVRWCKTKDILVGAGRGSVGGSLVAYLLGIIEIDPIEYGLLFERFLNKTRVSGERAKAADSLPDIDLDFEGARRDEVKRYLEEKYTYDNVCSVGTYTRLKVKSALKDFSRVKSLNFQEVNIATKQIPDYPGGVSFWYHIFEQSCAKKTLKQFIQNNFETVDVMRISMGQPKAASIHPSAVLIVPKEDKDGNPMTVFDWMPIKKIEGHLVSEWEGKYIDAAGFLKEDILGIAQLDKFHAILNLIEKNKGKKVDLNKIRTNINGVFEYFQNGWNEDVFQFGTSGLKSYSIQVKPDCIEDLVAMNALFRPGPMDSNAHKDFALIKHKKKKANIDPFMEEITSSTQGLYIYQETIMQAMVVGGLTLVESDQVRTYMKKKDIDNLNKFKEKFVNGYSSLFPKGDGKAKAEEVWDKLNAFSSYGFNKSHSAAYSLMGYWSQYLKVKYPLEFWTVSLNFAKEEEEIPNRISEIKRIGEDITVRPPSINKSEFDFVGLKDNIYWSMTKIKAVGEIAANIIIDERNKNGEFFDLEDFINRVPKNKVNKRVVKALIIAGALDEIGGIEGLPIKETKERTTILRNHMKLIKSDEYEELKSDNIESNWYWTLKQKELTGFGDIDFRPLVSKYSKSKSFSNNYKSGEDFDDLKIQNVKYGDPTSVAGRVMFIREKNYSRGVMGTVTVEHNNSVLIIVIWDEIWSKLSKDFHDLMQSKKLFAFSGVAKYDNYRNRNVIYSSDDSKLVFLN